MDPMLETRYEEEKVLHSLEGADMENPDTWNKATMVIMDALTDAYEQREAGVIGLSAARIIHDALEREGLLVIPTSQQDASPVAEKVAQCSECGERFDSGEVHECPAEKVDGGREVVDLLSKALPYLWCDSDCGCDGDILALQIDGFLIQYRAALKLSHSPSRETEKADL